MGDGITGWSDEGHCAFGVRSYEVDTIYKAVANTNKNVYRIFFLFSYSARVGKCINIGEGVYEGQWNVYHIGTATEIHHVCSEGVWIMSFHEGENPTWKFIQDDGYKYTPTISLANAKTRRNHYNTPDDPETLAQKNYREMVEEDKRKGSIYGTACTPAEYAKEEVRRTLRWYEKAKKEVKGKMYLQLIDVTIFNRKTKHVDFREDIIAENNDEAYLLAVQAFGKYDPKVHVKAANCILGFSEIADKKEEEG